MLRQRAHADMPMYHYFMVDSIGRVRRVESGACIDESEAKRRADILLVQYAFGAVEIWSAGRRLHRVQDIRRQTVL